MDDEIHSILQDLSQDGLIAGLIKAYPGLRLLRQDPEQCIISFVCASNTNISTIRRMLYSMTRKFGERVDFDGKTFSTFPPVAAIAKASERDLRACSLGYRARAVKETATKLASGEVNLSRLMRMGYEDAKSELLQIYGIGNKIADCILLFSLDKTEAFPIDVWIARSIARHYSGCLKGPIREKLTPHQYQELSEEMRSRFGRLAGYAQQYLYYDIRQRAGLQW